jgi:GxxExxY protein
MRTMLRRIEPEALNRLTEIVIGAAFAVSNELGHGFLEVVYENAMVHELQKAGLRVQPQKELVVRYDQVVVGSFFADLIVEDILLIELKAVGALDNNHLGQCLNYLKATSLPLALLINFGTPKVDIKRVINNF